MLPPPAAPIYAYIEYKKLATLKLVLLRVSVDVENWKQELIEATMEHTVK